MSLVLCPIACYVVLSLVYLYAPSLGFEVFHFLFFSFLFLLLAAMGFHQCANSAGVYCPSLRVKIFSFVGKIEKKCLS